MTVVIALAGLSVVGIPFLTVMGLAAAGTVLVADRHRRHADPRAARLRRPQHRPLAGRPGAHRLARGVATRRSAPAGPARVTERPVVALVAGLAVMLLLAVPMLVDAPRHDRRRHATRRRRPSARPTTCSPTASVPASTARCRSSSTSTAPRIRPRPRCARHRGPRRRPRRAARSASRWSTRPATPPSSRSSPQQSVVGGDRGPRPPPARRRRARGRGADRRRRCSSPARPRRTSTCPTRWPARCPCSCCSSSA